MLSKEECLEAYEVIDTLIHLMCGETREDGYEPTMDETINSMRILKQLIDKHFEIIKEKEEIEKDIRLIKKLLSFISSIVILSFIAIPISIILIILGVKNSVKSLLIDFVILIFSGLIFNILEETKMKLSYERSDLE